LRNASARLVEIRERLANLVGARRAIDVVRGRVMGEQEPQVVIDRRERRVDDLRGHEAREDFFHPDIAEPLHGDEIAEPHVRRLVGDHAGAAELLILRRRLVEHQAVGVVEDRARVLHAAELEGGHEQKIELAEWIWNARVALEPLKRRRVQVEDRLAVARDFRGVGFAMQHAERAAVPLRPFHAELPRGKREQVGRDRLGLGKAKPGPSVFGDPRALFAVGQRLPAIRHVERQRPSRFEIRLIEAGEREVRAGGHEDRVEKIIGAIERHVARVEVERDAVIAGAQGSRRHDQVPVHLPHVRPHAVHVDAAKQAGPIRAEVDGDRCQRVGERKGDHRAADHRLLFRERNRERQIVTEIGEPPHPRARERLADAGFRVRLGELRRAEQHQERDHH
jgi:hypothetical protein